MNRRDLLRLGGSTLLLSALPSFSLASPRRADSARLFFDPAAIPHIRATARTPLLRPVVEAWSETGPAAARAAVAQAVASGNLVYDLRDALHAMAHEAVLYILEPTDERRDVLLHGLEALVGLPKWDYFYEGGTEVIGIMRSSMATTHLLFAREALGDAVGEDLERRLLGAVAEKGCLPCYRTLVGMNDPASVEGWSFDEAHQSVYEISLDRWPEILGANNLRAVPTMGLGVGALALQGRDDRADLWLDTAVDSARHVLGFFSADGSYFEGLSYVDYTLRSLLLFMEAHYRLDGSVDWATKANFEGMVRFILSMQAGLQEDGTLDTVNFSDSQRTVYPSVPSWIAGHTGSPVAQFTAEHFAEPGDFLDFLWYAPARPSAPPPDALKNVRLDLDWVICRTGWEADDAVLAFRSGGPANHEHADRNSFIYKVYGERLLTDHFGAAYDWREPKWLLRLTEAHNAVLIDGEGHQYHEGEEGTNESLAEAELIRYEDEGDRVWWCSDATQAYHLVDPDVKRVRRTVLFAKPDVVVVLDQIEKTSTPSDVAVRFFPDNRDGEAAIAVGGGTDAGGGTFTIHRPKATLHGWTVARAPLGLTTARLDLDAEFGVYPYLEVTAAPALAHEVATVLVARPDGAAETPAVSVRPGADGWAIEVGGPSGLRVHIGPVDGGTLSEVPEVTWG